MIKVLFKNVKIYYLELGEIKSVFVVLYLVIFACLITFNWALNDSLTLAI